MKILEPKNAFWKGAKKHEVKKVIKSKNDCNESSPKFYKLGDEFFLFWRNLKNEGSTAKKRLFRGSKKMRKKKSSNQKMPFLKVVRNFTN